MKIEKLPSGSYRIRKMYKGKMYAVITDYKPTQKEAIMLMSEKMERAEKTAVHMTFEKAAEEYIEMKRNILSPSTIREYWKEARNVPDWFKELIVSDISQVDINRMVNECAKKVSPKTVRNRHGFVSAVLGVYNPSLKISTKLPQKVKSEPYIPSSDDVKRILDNSKGTKYEIPVMLACYGMRRSEICALTADDIDGDVVNINKALVQNDRNEWIVKTTKTTESTRSIIIPIGLAEKIREQGYAFKGNPEMITKHIEKSQEKLGIPRFSVHKLRHYFASKMSALGVPEADILKMGGWETDHVMKSVYRHSMIEKEENAKREAAEKFQRSLFS